jgi:hypothetical protein
MSGIFTAVVLISPGMGSGIPYMNNMIQCFFDPWFQDLRWKISGQIPDNISESFVITFGL